MLYITCSNTPNLIKSKLFFSHTQVNVCVHLLSTHHNWLNDTLLHCSSVWFHVSKHRAAYSNTHLSCDQSVGICHSPAVFLHLSSLLTSRLTAIIQSNTQHSLITNLSPSASPVIELGMIRAQLPYSRAARGLLVGYDCLDWLDSLATLMKYS